MDSPAPNRWERTILAYTNRNDEIEQEFEALVDAACEAGN